MSTDERSATILLIEDNPADIDLTRASLEEANILSDLRVARDGVEAMEFLQREPPYEEAPQPDLILLDLNLPRKDGRDVLEELKSDERLRTIPVVVLTSSEAETDIVRAYDLHANSYVVKPVGLDQFVDIMKTIEGFWLRVVTLPDDPDEDRTLFRDRLHQAARRAHGSDRVFSLAYIDLDHFKAVNDSFGHPAGDTLLKRVAERLREVIRERDTVARIGGDEFMLLLEEVGSRDNVERVGDRLERLFETPFAIESSDVYLSASIGFAFPDQERLLGEDELQLDQLVRLADRAMYASKQTTGTSWRIFDLSEKNSDVWEGHIQHENRIRDAIHNDEFIPYYQPIYSLEDDTIAAAEVLARWHEPERGTLSPGDFIPVAEESSLICDLGEVLLERVLRDFQERDIPWAEVGPFDLLVNLSPRQIEAHDAVNRLLEIADMYAPELIQLHFEVTETALLEHHEQLRRLREQAYGILIDDFGTGHSSLSRLKDLPVDGFKLDMEFIHGMLESPIDEAIVETITELGRRLEMPVIAEGVETSEQLERLREAHCSAAQGYHLARPNPFESLLEIIRPASRG